MSLLAISIFFHLLNFRQQAISQTYACMRPVKSTKVTPKNAELNLFQPITSWSTYMLLKKWQRKLFKGMYRVLVILRHRAMHNAMAFSVFIPLQTAMESMQRSYLLSFYILSNSFKLYTQLVLKLCLTGYLPRWDPKGSPSFSSLISSMMTHPIFAHQIHIPEKSCSVPTLLSLTYDTSPSCQRLKSRVERSKLRHRCPTLRLMLFLVF